MADTICFVIEELFIYIFILYIYIYLYINY